MNPTIPPLATPPDFISALSPQEEKEACWFIFSANNLLLSPDLKNLPTLECLTIKRNLFMGSLRDKNLFAAEAEKEHPVAEGWVWYPLRSLYNVLSDEYFSLAGRALQLLEWDRTHVFCGCCGNKTFVREKERCRECPACGYLAYAKVAPAVIVLVKKDNKILLVQAARLPHTSEKFYSALAGFVDPGETLEQCIAREVFEEVGLKIKNIHYYGSQPWPFSGALMIAFTCDWQEGEITIDPSELVDADWFESAHLPSLPPLLSISRMLIESNCTKGFS